jgi:oligopeptidase B
MRIALLLTFLACLVAACTPSQDESTAMKSESASASVGQPLNDPSTIDAGVALPPQAPQRPHELTIHSDTRVDDYYWLRDDSRSDPEVLAYLNAENSYLDTRMADTQEMQESLFQEMVARIKQDDSTVPVKSGDYWYLERYVTGSEYPIIARRKGSAEGPEQEMLDVNVLAQGHEYFRVGNWEVSDNQRLLAYAEDNVSRRIYTIRIKDLDSGELLDDAIPGTSGAIAWASDNQTLFYVLKDPETLLPYKVMRHRLGSPVTDDVAVYEESDNTFYTSVYRGKSKDYIYIHLSSTLSDEVRLLPADQPEGELRLFLAREDGHEYSVDDVDGRFFVTTNWDARNFRLMETTLAQAGDRDAWGELQGHSEDVFIHGVEASHWWTAWRSSRSNPMSPHTPCISMTTRRSTPTSCDTDTPR